MQGGRDLAYLRRRAREERAWAEAAADAPARLAHAQLADLYESEAKDAEGAALPSADAQSGAALFKFVER